MKKNLLSGLSAMLIIAFISSLVYSCAPKPLNFRDMGEVEFVSPCSGPKFQSSSRALRFSSYGESKEQMTAKKKALSEARAGLAATINTTVKGVTDTYVQSANYDNKERVTKHYESLIREVVNQNLHKAVIICERMTITKRGRYKYYIALEQSNKDLLSSLNMALASNELVNSGYDYGKFLEVFEATMSKLGNE